MPSTHSQVTLDPLEADFLLAHGTEAISSPSGTVIDTSLEEMRDVLKQCVKIGLPLIVANPDLVSREREIGASLGRLVSEFVRRPPPKRYALLVSSSSSHHIMILSCD